MNLFKKPLNFLTRTLAGKFTIFILGLVMIIISLLIWFNFQGSMNIVNNQNTSFIGNSEHLINKNFKYTIDQIDNLLNKQFVETSELLKNNLTQATVEKGKAIITNLSGQLGNAISNYDFGFGVTAFNEIFKNDNSVVYAA
nr:hypothetical protein [Candidatus Dependentiae bacterium]